MEIQTGRNTFDQSTTWLRNIDDYRRVWLYLTDTAEVIREHLQRLIWLMPVWKSGSLIKDWYLSGNRGRKKLHKWFARITTMFFQIWNSFIHIHPTGLRRPCFSYTKSMCQAGKALYQQDLCQHHCTYEKQELRKERKKLLHRQQASVFHWIEDSSHCPSIWHYFQCFFVPRQCKFGDITIRAGPKLVFLDVVLYQLVFSFLRSPSWWSWVSQSLKQM